MSSVIGFNLDQSEILLSGNGLRDWNNCTLRHVLIKYSNIDWRSLRTKSHVMPDYKVFASITFSCLPFTKQAQRVKRCLETLLENEFKIEKWKILYTPSSKKTGVYWFSSVRPSFRNQYFPALFSATMHHSHFKLCMVLWLGVLHFKLGMCFA